MQIQLAGQADRSREYNARGEKLTFDLIAASPDGAQAAFCTDGKIVYYANFETGASTSMSPWTHEQGALIVDLVFCTHNGRFLALTDSSEIYAISFLSGSTLVGKQRIDDRIAPINSLCASKYQNLVITGHRSGQVGFWTFAYGGTLLLSNMMQLAGPNTGEFEPQLSLADNAVVYEDPQTGKIVHWDISATHQRTVLSNELGASIMRLNHPADGSAQRYRVAAQIDGDIWVGEKGYMDDEFQAKLTLIAFADEPGDYVLVAFSAFQSAFQKSGTKTSASAFQKSGTKTGGRILYRLLCNESAGSADNLTLAHPPTEHQVVMDVTANRRFIISFDDRTGMVRRIPNPVSAFVKAESKQHE